LKPKNPVLPPGKRIVAPFTGAWIETTPRWKRLRKPPPSPPSRGRGLKPTPLLSEHDERHVAPFTGAWIETRFIVFILASVTGRPLHGGVD